MKKAPIILLLHLPHIFSFFSFLHSSYSLSVFMFSFSFHHSPYHHTHDGYHSHHWQCYCHFLFYFFLSFFLYFISLSLSLSLSLTYHTHDSHTTTPLWAPPSPSMVKLTISSYCQFDVDNAISSPWHPFIPLSYRKFQKW